MPLLSLWVRVLQPEPQEVVSLRDLDYPGRL